jgi:hypothetical protein
MSAAFELLCVWGVRGGGLLGAFQVGVFVLETSTMGHAVP